MMVQGILPQKIPPLQTSEILKQNPKTHKMTNIAGETKATMNNHTDEDEDEMFCTPVYCLETLLPMRESRGTLSSSVIWFG